MNSRSFQTHHLIARQRVQRMRSVQPGAIHPAAGAEKDQASCVGRRSHHQQAGACVGKVRDDAGAALQDGLCRRVAKHSHILRHSTVRALRSSLQDTLRRSQRHRMVSI